MPISFACGKCGKNLKVKDSLAGRAAKCPDCGNTLRVPGGDTSGAATPSRSKSQPDAEEYEDPWEPEPLPSPARRKAGKSRTPSSNPYEYSSGGSGVQSGGTVKLKRVGVLSVAVMGGAAGLLGGLLVACLMFLFTGLIAAAAPQGASVGGVLGGGVMMLVLLPIFYGVGGFIAGALYGAIYNIVAGFAGGIEMEFE